jgi:hypothetical protein
VDRCILLEYAYFPNLFFAILPNSLALMFTYCIHKYIVANLILLHYYRELEITSFVLFKTLSQWKMFQIKSVDPRM